MVGCVLSQLNPSGFSILNCELIELCLGWSPGAVVQGRLKLPA